MKFEKMKLELNPHSNGIFNLFQVHSSEHHSPLPPPPPPKEKKKLIILKELLLLTIGYSNFKLHVDFTQYLVNK